jgi:hypothetical protein
MNYKIFTYANYKYIEIAEYWASFVERLKLNYTVYCTDRRGYQYLLDKNINCTMFDTPTEGRDFNFNDFGLIRFKILSELLDKYEYVIYSDADAIWIDNPLGDIFEHSYDAHLSTVHHRDAYPASIRKKWGMTICTGWMGFKHTARNLILDFIGQYYSFKNGLDQANFNEFIYSINNKIDKDIHGHSFVSDLKEYQLKLLGIGKNLIHRGETVDGCKVVHPLSGSSETLQRDENRKLRVLRNEVGS